MASFWRGVLHFETAKLTPWIALRNALGVALPLTIGAITGHASTGLVATTGALNVAFSDGSDPYLHRLRRMIGASLCCALAVIAGGLSGTHPVVAVSLAALCAFAAGMMVSLGAGPTDIANVTLVTLIVFSSQSMTPGQSVSAGAAALAGGLLQTAFSITLWPFRRYLPERQALAGLFRQLAQSTRSHPQVLEAPPASLEAIEARTALASLVHDHTIEAERYLALLSQAERIRLAILAIARLRTRISRETEAASEAAILDRCLDLAGAVLGSIAAMLEQRSLTIASPKFDDLRTLSERLRLSEMRRDARRQVDALAGQLRAAWELADHATPAGSTVFARREAAQPWRLRLAGSLAVLRANLHLQSPALRHALRLTVCVTAGEVVAHAVSWRRPYWIPMTAAIVLRPDFTTTLSRGVLRVAGTLAGLGVATALFHLLAPSAGVEVALIGIFGFLLRFLGPANYGVFAAALSALVVQMLAVTGIEPGTVIGARALNTIVGGAIALLAYRLWPTWERTLVSDTVARMLDAYRLYFRAVVKAYVQPDQSTAEQLESARQAGRLARSYAEASVARLATEPGVEPARLARAGDILANSHRFVHAAMSLEAGLIRSRHSPPRDAFGGLCRHVDLTLYYLAAALRGSTVTAADLPDLREDHNALLHSGAPGLEPYALANVETDRIVNSLNTLAALIIPGAGDAA